MIRLTPVARAQVRALNRFYAARHRTQAMHNLAAAIERAATFIEAAPEQGSPSPRPYPGLVRPGLLWLKSGRYWIAYDAATLTITQVFFETDDIPGRVGWGRDDPDQNRNQP